MHLTWGANQWVALWLAVGYFTSIVILGFAFGHERAIRDVLRDEPNNDTSKPPWRQPELYAKAKKDAQKLFPGYWYWGITRSAALMLMLALLADVSGASYFANAAVTSAGLLAVICYFLARQAGVKDPPRN